MELFVAQYMSGDNEQNIQGRKLERTGPHKNQKWTHSQTIEKAY